MDKNNGSINNRNTSKQRNDKQEKIKTSNVKKYLQFGHPRKNNTVRMCKVSARGEGIRMQRDKLPLLKGRPHTVEKEKCSEY